MSEITTISDLSQDEQKFADVIIKIVSYRYAKYEQEYQERKESKRVPVADIKISPENFKNYIPDMEGISRHQGWKVTAEKMLEKFHKKCILEVYTDYPVLYMLNKDGFLYKDLVEALEGTP